MYNFTSQEHHTEYFLLKTAVKKKKNALKNFLTSQTTNHGNVPVGFTFHNYYTVKQGSLKGSQVILLYFMI